MNRDCECGGKTRPISAVHIPVIAPIWRLHYDRCDECMAEYNHTISCNEVKMKETGEAAKIRYKKIVETT